MQTQADLLQVPVLVSRSPDATALGVAALARLGTGDAGSAPRRWGRLRWKRSWSRHHRRPGGRTAGGLPRPPPTSRWPGDDAVPARTPRPTWRSSGPAWSAPRSPGRWPRTTLDLVLLDAAADVGTGTSKANTAILHTGFDAMPGSLEAACCAAAARCCALRRAGAGIPVERTGALLVAWTPEQAGGAARHRGERAAQRVPAIRPLRAGELYAREPPSGRARWARSRSRTRASSARGPRRWPSPPRRPGRGPAAAVPPGSPGSPRPAACTSWRRRAGRCGAGGWSTRPGSAATWSTRCSAAAGSRSRPRRGELIVFDKLARPLLRSILLPVPTAQTKGVLVAPTVYGNVLLGPTAQDVADRSDTATTAAGLGSLLGAGRRILPGLAGEEVTATYAGLRAATEHRDYQIQVDGGAAVRVRGRHPLHRPVRVARHRRARRRAAGRRRAARCSRAAGSRGCAAGRCRTSARRARGPTRTRPRIAADPDYGQIVCHCERVTRGEIRDALASSVPPADLDGLRRRTRAMNGRCQGFYCAAAVAGCAPGAGTAAGRQPPRPQSADRPCRLAGVVLIGARAGRAGRRRSSCGGSAPGRCWWPTGRPEPGGVPRHCCAHRVRAARPAPGA